MTAPTIKFSDDELDEEAAWSIVERRGWIPTPLLVFSLKDLIREKRLEEEDMQRQLHLSTLLGMMRP